MYYKLPTQKQLKFFQENGFIVLENCIDPEDLDLIEECCDKVLDNPSQFNVFDWALTDDSNQTKKINILQVAGSKHFPSLKSNRALNWLRAISHFFMQQEIDFWFDQFLVKPPYNHHETPWHQDEAYWGRALADKAITAWIPLQNVSKKNGCMHFLGHYHKKEILNHYRPSHIKSDLLSCDINDHNVIACPIQRGSVTLHHVRTPHMTTKNDSDSYRKALCLHLKNPNVAGEGDVYPWRVYVKQQKSTASSATKPNKKEDYYF